MKQQAAASALAGQNRQPEASSSQLRPPQGGDLNLQEQNPPTISSSETNRQPEGNQPNPSQPVGASGTDQAGGRITLPWEYIEEVAGTLKTQAPMLHPSLEMLAEQLFTRFKPNPDEEIYRFILALLNEGMQVCCSHYFGKANDAKNTMHSNLWLSVEKRTTMAQFRNLAQPMLFVWRPDFHLPRGFVLSSSGAFQHY
jgi:hypothetical protein